MAYADIASLNSDSDFRQRVTACAATEGESDPVAWANEHSWAMAATPGFGDKYAYAVATGVVRPGNDPSVISDGDILSAVQGMEGVAVASSELADDAPTLPVGVPEGA